MTQVQELYGLARPVGTVVVDHDTGRLAWAAPGNDKPTLAAFFELLGPDRCA